MLQVHERLGDFEIIRLLGKGGMGEVYEARQFNPDRRVAVKVLAPWLANDEDSLKRFFREAEVPANLDHPGIVRIIMTGKTPEGVAYIAMHLVRGISLAEMIQQASMAHQSVLPTRTAEHVATPSMAPPIEDTPPQSPASVADSIPPLMQDYRHDRFATVARIGAQAARALAFAHEQGHVHRDIKPSNLMVDIHNQVYLVDFGLTRGLEPAADGTQPGTLIGTYWYMSPEQAGGWAVDAASDIYSLGVTLYELATGGLGPFTANRSDKKSVLAQVRSGQTLPLRTLANGIPPELERIILKAMHLKPQKRYASAAEMARELEAFLGHVSKPSSRSVRPADAKPGSGWSTRVACAVGLIALVICAAVAVAIAMRDRNPIEKPVVGDKPKFDGSLAEPHFLRNATPNSPISLLTNDNKPHWQDIAFGIGKPFPMRSLTLIPAGIYGLALADPDRKNFTFEVELMSLAIDENKDAGVFFGWRRAAPDGNDYFLVKVNRASAPDGPHGRVIIGTGHIHKGNDKQGAVMRFFQPLSPPEKSTIALPNRPNQMQSLKVIVADDRFTVNVKGGKAQSFTVAEALSDGRVHTDLHTHGAIGIWVRNTEGLFEGAKITVP